GSSGVEILGGDFNVAGTLVRDVTVHSNSGTGIMIDHRTAASLVNLSAYFNGGHGITVTPSAGVYMQDLTAIGHATTPHNNLRLDSADNVTVVNALLAYGEDGLYMSNSNDVVFHGLA